MILRSASWRRRALGAALLGVVIVSPAVSAVEVTFPSGHWAPPQRLLIGAFEEVSALLAPDGATHIVTVGDSGVWYVTDGSGAWRRHRLLAHRPDRGWGNPALAIDDDGRLHLALAENRCLEAIWPCLGPIFHLTDRGRASGDFSTPRGATERRSASPALKMTQGRPHLAWTRYPTSDSIDQDDWFRVGYQVGTGASSVPMRLGKGSHPQLRVGTDGRPRIAYLGDRDTRVLLATGRRDTTSFRVERVSRARAGTLAHSPGLVLDWRERPLVLWSLDQGRGADRAFVSRRSADGAWTRRSVGSSRWATAISVDRRDRAHVAIADRDGLHEVIVSEPLERWTVDPDARRLRDVELRIAASGEAVAVWTIDSGPRAGLWAAHR